MCMCECRCPQSPEESVRFPWVGAPSSCEPPIQVLGTEGGSPARPACAPNLSHFSSAASYSSKRTEVRKGWRDGSLKSSCHSWKGPDFDSQHPCGSQLLAIPVPGDSVPLSDLWWLWTHTVHMCVWPAMSAECTDKGDRVNPPCISQARPLCIACIMNFWKDERKKTITALRSRNVS